MANTSESRSVPEQTPAAPSRPPVQEKFDPDRAAWELYNSDSDFSQANDLAEANPQKLRQLQDLWWAEAAKHTRSPIDRLPFDFIGRIGEVTVALKAK